MVRSGQEPRFHSLMIKNAVKVTPFKGKTVGFGAPDSSAPANPVKWSLEY